MQVLFSRHNGCTWFTHPSEVSCFWRIFHGTGLQLMSWIGDGCSRCLVSKRHAVTAAERHRLRGPKNGSLEEHSALVDPQQKERGKLQKSFLSAEGLYE